MKLNRTTLRTVDILKLVSKRPDGITLDEICERLELPKTSAYDIVTTLVQTGKGAEAEVPHRPHRLPHRHQLHQQSGFHQCHRTGVKGICPGGGQDRVFRGPLRGGDHLYL